MKRELHPTIYIMTNKFNSVLYTGVTSNLVARVTEHKSGEIPGFTNTYKVNKLVYFEEFATMNDAISREKQIKAGSRRKKVDLINKLNPQWRDLYEDFFV